MLGLPKAPIGPCQVLFGDQFPGAFLWESGRHCGFFLRLGSNHLVASNCIVSSVDSLRGKSGVTGITLAKFGLFLGLGLRVFDKTIKYYWACFLESCIQVPFKIMLVQGAIGALDAGSLGLFRLRGASAPL